MWFVAINPIDGKTLEIQLASGGYSAEPTTTVDTTGNWVETAQGWSVRTPAGLFVSVSCNIGLGGQDFVGTTNYCDFTSGIPPFAEDDIARLPTRWRRRSTSRSSTGTSASRAATPSTLQRPASSCRMQWHWLRPLYPASRSAQPTWATEPTTSTTSALPPRHRRTRCQPPAPKRTSTRPYESCMASALQ